MSEPFIGEIRMVTWNWAPSEWALCNGQTLSIQQYTALFSLLGTTYGGDGIQTFNLPNLCGRVPMNFGQGPGLTNRVLGESSGAENITLVSSQMPMHSHLIQANSASADQPSPLGNYPATIADSGGSGVTGFSTTQNGTMSATAISPAGANQPHPNLQPYLCVNFIIALQGIYPPRP